MTDILVDDINPSSDNETPLNMDDVKNLRFIASRLTEWRLSNYAMHLRSIADQIERELANHG